MPLEEQPKLGPYDFHLLYGPHVKRCNAPARWVSGVRKCRKPARKGTTLCWMHGGRKPQMYSKNAKGNLGAKFREMLSQKRNVSLDEELAVLRTVGARMMELAENSTSIRSETTYLEMLKSSMDDVRRMVETIKRIELKDAITPEHLVLLMRNILHVLSEEVGEKVLKKVAQRFEQIDWFGGVDLKGRVGGVLGEFAFTNGESPGDEDDLAVSDDAGHDDFGGEIVHQSSRSQF